MRAEKMHIGAFFKNTGHHIASWRHPGSQPDAGVNLKHYIECAQLAEKAVFDFLFFADSLAVRGGKPEAIARSAQFTAYFEPITLLSALAPMTEKIGLIATANLIYNAPYHVARKFASLDHLSGGRAGWNMVVSGNPRQEANFGSEALIEHDLRYEMAGEFLEVVKGLWDSWEDDAFVYDQKSGIFLDPAKMHALNHEGRFYKVRGPLNVPRAPQGYPVLFQAGTSEAGREFCALAAEGVFTSELTLARSQAHYGDVKGRMSKYGRLPEDMVIMPGCTVFVGATMAEARDREEELAALIEPIVGVEYLTMLTDIDLSAYDPDELFPYDQPSERHQMGAFQSVINLVKDERLTIRQLYRRLAGSHAKLALIGTPSTIADTMSDWFHNHACDGFIIQPSTMPGDLQLIADLLVPELQDRGLVQSTYHGNTLREHMGLARPENRYCAAA